MSNRALRIVPRLGHLRLQGVNGVAATRTRVQAWTAKELAPFLEHVQADRLFPLWRLAAMSGMRRGELAGLTWRCLDLAASRLSVEQQFLPTRGGVSFGPPKSARSRRTIALDAETVRVLEEHRKAQILERAFAADAYVGRWRPRVR